MGSSTTPDLKLLELRTGVFVFILRQVRSYGAFRFALKDRLLAFHLSLERLLFLGVFYGSGRFGGFLDSLRFGLRFVFTACAFFLDLGLAASPSCFTRSIFARYSSSSWPQNVAPNPLRAHSWAFKPT